MSNDRPTTSTTGSSTGSKSTSAGSVAERRLREQLHSAASDPAVHVTHHDIDRVAAQVVARAHAQGRRHVRRRRRLLLTGAATAAIAGLAVAATQLSGSSVTSVPVAGRGGVHTVPDSAPPPFAGSHFVVDPGVQQGASDTFNAVVTAALPAVPAAQAEVSFDAMNFPLSVGQPGWQWSSEVSASDPWAMLWISVDQLKPQPQPVVSACQGQDASTCVDEVLADGSYLVSGYQRGTTVLGDGAQVVFSTPYARLVRSDGRVIEAQVMSGSASADADGSPDIIKGMTSQALRLIVSGPGLGAIAMPSEAAAG